MHIESFSRYRSNECPILAGHVATKYMPVSHETLVRTNGNKYKERGI